MSQRLVVATKNIGKVKEILELVEKYGFEVSSLIDEPEHTGFLARLLRRRDDTSPR